MPKTKIKLTDLERFNIRLTRLLEEHELRLFPNAIGSFTAAVKKHGKGRQTETDDFTAVKAILRLHDKVFGEGEYASGEAI